MPLACACHPYSVLLPVGFTLPPALPQARCALAAPFHPYPADARAPKPGGLLSVALSLGSPPPAVSRHRIPVEPGLSSSVAAGGRPTVWREGMCALLPAASIADQPHHAEQTRQRAGIGLPGYRLGPPMALKRP